MRVGKSISTILIVLGIFLSVSVSSASATYYSDVQVTAKGYSLAGILVIQETLHADGTSTATTGNVTDVWLTTDRCWFPNNIINEKTWTAYHPNGEYAKGSFKNAIGIPSPWGAIGMSQSTQYLSILF